jgi:cytosine/adenosine deaminase-related metal-dependent hydrolase
MAAAVHRSADGREPWNPDESLTPAQALGASTDGQPMIDAGSRGDVVLLDADPLAPQPSSGEAALTLRGMPVAATIVAGRVVHTRI